MSHTPGPWKLDGFLIVDARGEEVLDLGGYSTLMAGRLKNPADARLIAAAPEMLAALKLAYPLLTDKAAREEIGALLNSLEAS